MSCRLEPILCTHNGIFHARSATGHEKDPVIDGGMLAVVVVQDEVDTTRFHQLKGQRLRKAFEDTCEECS